MTDQQTDFRGKFMDMRAIADKVLVVLNVAGKKDYCSYFNSDTGEIEHIYLLKMMKLLESLSDDDRAALIITILYPIYDVDFNALSSPVKPGKTAMRFITAADVRCALLLYDKDYRNLDDLLKQVFAPKNQYKYTGRYTFYRIIAQHRTVLWLREVAKIHPSWLPDRFLGIIADHLLAAERWLTGLGETGLDFDMLAFGEDVRDLITETIDQFQDKRLENLDLELSPLTPEINQDREAVQEEINRYGFPDELSQIINKIEDNFRASQDDFDYSSTIGLIRKFFENLAIAIALEVEQKTGIPTTPPLDGMGKARAYLRKRDIRFFDEKMDELVGQHHGLFSNEGAHPLTSDREMARICKNIAVEMALYLFRRLDRFLIDAQVTTDPRNA